MPDSVRVDREVRGAMTPTETTRVDPAVLTIDRRVTTFSAENAAIRQRCELSPAKPRPETRQRSKC